MASYYNHNTLVYLDGEFIPAAHAQTDLYGQTLHYGSGVFEGIRAYNTPKGTRIFKAREHYERLHYSAQKMHLKLSHTVEELIDISYQLLAKNNLQDAYIRPLVYSGVNMSLTPTPETHLFIAVWDWGRYLGSNLQRLYLSSFQRPNPKSTFIGAKIVGHYTNSIMATTEAKGLGYDEALLCDCNGNIAEASGANFFYEKDGELYTAPEGNILRGITRATVIEIAQEMGVKLTQKLFDFETLKTADAAFLCGTAAEIAGVQSVSEYQFPMDWQQSKGYQIHQIYKKLTTEG
jgi:branched-chain amino acid aminotransferase